MRIVSDEIVLPQDTRFDGVFKMGKAIPGSYNITVTKDDYYPKTIIGDFVNGVVLTPVIELVAIPTYQVTGNVIYSDGGNVPFAKVTLLRTGCCV